MALKIRQTIDRFWLYVFDYFIIYKVMVRRLVIFEFFFMIDCTSPEEVGEAGGVIGSGEEISVPLVKYEERQA